ncbi:MAG: hypothetical protein AAGJ94_02700 [Pseudomonadota bacterium]
MESTTTLSQTPMPGDDYASIARDVATMNAAAWLTDDRPAWRSTFHDDVTLIVQPSAAFTVPWAGVYVSFASVSAFNDLMQSCMLWDKEKIVFSGYRPNSADPHNTNLCERTVQLVGAFVPTGNRFDFVMNEYIEAKDGKLFRSVITFDEAEVSRQFWGTTQRPADQAIDALKLSVVSSRQLPLCIAPLLKGHQR